MLAQLVVSKPVNLIDQSMGLTSPYNFYMYKDSKGLVWICSVSGIYQYNGKQLKHLKPEPADKPTSDPHHVHSYFIEDKESNIWFGTWGGISCYVSKADSFVQYVPSHINPRSRFTVFSLDSLDQLWFLHNDAIHTFNVRTGTFKQIARVGQNLNNAEGQLDMHGRMRYVYVYGRYKRNPGLHITYLNGESVTGTKFIPLDSDTVSVSDLHVVSQSTVLLASSVGLIKYDHKSSSSERILQNAYRGDPKIYSLTVYQDSLLLVGTADDGYYVLDPVREIFVQHFHIHAKGGNLFEAPLGMYTDRDGCIWMHLDGRGVVYFLPGLQVFDYYPIEVDENDRRMGFYVNCLISINQQTVFSASRVHKSQFFRVLNGIPVEMYPCQQCPSTIMYSMKDMKDQVWMSAMDGMYKMEGSGKVSKAHITSTAGSGFGFVELPDGRFLHESLGRIYSKQPGSDTFSRLDFPDTNFFCSYLKLLPDGLLYGLSSMMDSNASSFIRSFDPQQQYRIVRDYDMNLAIRVAERIGKSNDILLGTNTGLFVFSPVEGKFQALHFSPFGESTVWGLIPLSADRFLACGEQLIAMIDMQHQRAQVFGLEHGLGHQGVTIGGFFKHPSGKIWLAHTDGISIIDEHKLVPGSYVSIIHFGSIKVNQHDFTLATHVDSTLINPNEVEHLRLQYFENTISFDYAAISYAGINHHTFEYRMNGLEDHWNEDNGQGFARYVNLPDGEFDFEVRVKGEPLTLRKIHLTVVPPFYEKPWFVTLLCLSMVGLGYEVLRWRDRRRRKLMQLQYESKLAIEKERLRISNNLHDDLGSALSGLNLRAQVIAQKTSEPETKAEVNQLAENTQRLVGQIRETIWTINAQHDTVDSLVTKLHEYALDYFDGTSIDCKVSILKDQVTNVISGHHRREIYLAFKEALHNIQKHAKATEVLIDIRLEKPRQLIVEIRDNGVGFEQETSKNGLGLNSMKQRMKEIQGDLRIVSDKTGTLIQLEYTI